MWFQQVIQPGRPGSFFKCDVHIPAQSVEELQNCARLGAATSRFTGIRSWGVRFLYLNLTVGVHFGSSRGFEGAEWLRMYGCN
jgi:hypothetical protein